MEECGEWRERERLMRQMYKNMMTPKSHHHNVAIASRAPLPEPATMQACN